MALIVALIVMLIVLGVIGIFSMLAMGESRQGRSDRQRAESLYWAESAGDQVLAQVRSDEVGPHTLAGSAPGLDYWSVPGSGKRPLTVRLPDGSRGNGFYEILAPEVGAPPNSIAYHRNPADREHRGELVLVLRGSTAANDPSPRVVRVVLRRSSLAKYAIVSDEAIDIGNLGSSVLSGSVHSNNIENKPVGISMSSANSVGAGTVSTTSGVISGSCQAAECVSQSQKSVSFTDVERAMTEVERLAARGFCPGGSAPKVACVVAPTVNWQQPDHAAAYVVRLDGAGGCVNVTRGQMPLRTDSGVSAIVDDRFRSTTTFGSVGTYCPDTGGMALLFNADVQLEGLRSATAPPVTIMARNTSHSRTYIGGTATTRQQPGSIYLVQRLGTAGVGSASSLNPVGIVAEGSVYLPNWAIDPAAASSANLNLQNVAIAALEGELGLGPMSLAMSGSIEGLSGAGTDARAGGGINPCMAPTSFRDGRSLTITGAVASRRAPVLGYGSSTSCAFGYVARTYRYANDLEWNPPPLYATTSPWHIAEWDELAATS